MPTDQIRERRRDVERVLVNRRLLLRTPRGNVLQALAHDLSLAGVGVRCDLSTSYALYFDDLPVNGRGPTFEIRLGLPFAADLVELRATGRLLHRRVNSRSDVILGFNFTALDEDNREILDGFLRYSMARALHSLVNEPFLTPR